MGETIQSSASARSSVRMTLSRDRRRERGERPIEIWVTEEALFAIDSLKTNFGSRHAVIAEAVKRLFEATRTGEV